MKKWKLFFHINFWVFWLISLLIKSKVNLKLNSLSHDELKRINYYIKVKQKFNFSNSNFSTLKNLNINSSCYKKNKPTSSYKLPSGYFYDFYKIFYKFPFDFKFRYLFGDINFNLNFPTFVKSRPINAHNFNSILMPFDTYRHFFFIDDKKSFDEKIPKIIWRGAAHQNKRIFFLKHTQSFPFVDGGCILNTPNNPYFKNWMSIHNQLNYKFIFSIEGNDVATNLKWIMSSNSLCFMFKPKIESWFMEGALVGGIHYVEIKDDLSDLEAKFAYYLKNPAKAKKIISNANRYVLKFKDLNYQYNLARFVVLRYGKLSSQI